MTPSRTAIMLAVLIFAIATDTLSAQAARREGAAAAAARALSTEYLNAYQTRYPESDAANLDGMFDNSLQAYQAWSRRQSRFLERVRRMAPAIDRGAPESVTLALLEEHLEMSWDFRVCRRELWNAGPLTSWLPEYRAYAARQQVGSDTARRAALGRWRKFPAFIDTEIENLRVGVRAGYTSPRVLVISAIAQSEAILNSPVAESPFNSPAARDTSPEFRSAFESLVRERITPALCRYRDYLANEYSKTARQSVGVSAIPRGASCFQALIRRYTTLDLTPAMLNAKGRELLATEDAAAIRDRQMRLIADTANQFRTSQEALETMARALRRAGNAAPRWFGRLPQVLVPDVDSMPDAGPSDADAVYVPGTATEPPRVYVNVPRIMEPGGRLYAERLAFHEGMPGHHLQISMQRATNAHPLNRLLWNAGFGEGWAVYASNLAETMGLYSSAATRFASTKSKVDDGLTFVVQYGLHTQGWSRQQAVDTILKYSGGVAEEAERQVDYFIAAPAHALAYPVGARYIEDLRDDASRRLGSKFDVRRFHDVILTSGALPLTVLRGSVDRWVRSELVRVGDGVSLSLFDRFDAWYDSRPSWIRIPLAAVAVVGDRTARRPERRWFQRE